MKSPSPISAARKITSLLSVAALFTMVACGGDKPPEKTAAKPGAKPAAGAVASAAPAATAAASAEPAVEARDGGVMSPPVEYTENDFVENDRNRDPFRSYAKTFAESGPRQTANQRQVLLNQFAIDELKLAAIVMSGDYPRAMFIDPTGKGWVIKRGDFVGRPDTVHTGGTNGTDYQLNWRVERVRDGEVVLIREDPAQPGIPPATRILPMRPEEAKLETN